jgi:phosphoribosyl-ATP pyrophosphohydrolase
MQLQITEFHEKFGHIIGTSPQIRRPELRAKLIREEAKETIDAIEADDLVGAVDGICDLLYVAIGTAIEFGLDIEPFFDEVHRTNMSKEGGGKDALGKTLKPPGWKRPRIAEEIERQRKPRPEPELRVMTAQGAKGGQIVAFRPLDGTGNHLTWDDFVNYCRIGTFVDFDGFAELATADAVSEISIAPSNIANCARPWWATHVVWYNR